MLQYLKQLAKFFTSARAADELYEHSRSMNDRERGVRTRFTFHIALLISVFIFTFLTMLTFNYETPAEYIRERQGTVPVPKSNVEFRYTDPEVSACDSAEGCFQHFTSENRQFYVFDHDDPQLDNLERPFVGQAELQTAQFATRVSVSLPAFEDPTTDGTLVIFMPRFQFRAAHVFVGGSKERTFLNSERMSFPVKSDQVNGKPFYFDIVFSIEKSDARRFVRWNEPVFLATNVEALKYERFLEARRANPNKQVSTTARIVLALFALILFMIVESSPESLGLALFMGFEAMGIAMGHGDLRVLWLPDDWNLKLPEHYCHAMGDIFRAYFYVQLARIARPNVGKWLFWGSLYALPYAYLRYIEFDMTIFGTAWERWMVSGRDTVIASFGVLICARQAMHLRRRGLPWRVGALSLATAAASAQFFAAAPFFFPGLRIIGDLFGGYSSFVYFVNANGAYCFALSTFLNISTLENRVRVLTREKTRAQKIERELELGRSVQQAFLELPKMPSDIRLSCHYEAAVYVSGDTYFVHWNKQLNVLTFLLNDVTGHGIQAALKAFACNIIARSVWSKPGVRNDRRSSEQTRLERYDAAVEELICRDGDIPDFNAMVGAEFHQETGQVRLYRVNYNFPVLIEPRFGNEEEFRSMLSQERWSIRQIPVQNRQVYDLQLRPGAFLLLISDGFLETARDNRQFLGYLNRVSPQLDFAADTQTIRRLALQWEGSAEKKADDRTLLVFQWQPEAVEKESFGPGEENSFGAA